MNGEEIEMAGECTDSYIVEKMPDGRTKITMVIPKNCSLLWRVKLSDLRTTEEEIEYYRQSDSSENPEDSGFRNDTLELIEKLKQFQANNGSMRELMAYLEELHQE